MKQLPITSIRFLCSYLLNSCYHVNTQRPVIQNKNYAENGLAPFIPITKSMLECTEDQEGTVYLFKLPKGYKIVKE